MEHNTERIIKQIETENPLLGAGFIIKKFRETPLSYFLTDQKGYICPKKEWEAVKARIDAFYTAVSEEEIEEYNKYYD